MQLGGMRTRGVLLKIFPLIVLVLMPLILSGISYSQPVSTGDSDYFEHTADSFHPVLLAGDFQYYNLKLSNEVEKICIIAYHGDSIPEPEDRSVGNYYRWEYDNGIWMDESGHDLEYLDPSHCVEDNGTFSFFVRIDKKAMFGNWNVKVLVNDKEVESSNFSFMVVTQFNLFLSSLIGVYKPPIKDKKFFIDIDFICSDRKRVIAESKEHIDDLVDEVLNKHATSNQEKDTNEIYDLCFIESKKCYKDESEKSAISTYPRSRLKTGQSNTASSLFFNKKLDGGNVFGTSRSEGYKRFLAIIVTIVLLSVAFVPIITPQDTASSFPIINSFKIFPKSVYFNDSLFLNVTVTDDIGIKSVVADIADLEIVNMSFIEGTIVNDTIYSGTWQSTWIVMNVDTGVHTIEITAINENNQSISVQDIFTVLSANNENNTINETTEPEFNESNNINQTEEQNYTNPYENETIQNDLLNNTVDQNNSNNSIDNSTNSDSFISNSDDGFNFVNTSTDDVISSNQTSIDSNESTVFIVDKTHEQLSVVPGTRFCVERTVDGPHGTNVVFVPMFSDALTLESIEVIEDNNNYLNLNSNFDNSPKVFSAGEPRCQKEQEIEQLKETLPPEIKMLNTIGYTADVELQSPRTIRMWFRAPSWEEIQSKSKLSSGEISYLVFSDNENDSFDFEGSTWWNSNWDYRKLITVNSSQVPANLNNFPILVNITDTDLRDDAQNDGDDIAFVLWSDNTTQLNHEIELFNGTTGELFAWVNVTSLSSSVDTKIWMYYNNSAASNQQNPTGVWDDDYWIVWHLNESSSPSQDSTANGNDGTWGAGKTAADSVDAKVGNGTDFDGITTDTISSSAGLAALKTISFWYNRDSTVGNWDTLFEGNPDNDEPFIGFGDGGDINDIEIWYNGGQRWNSAAKSLDTWYYFVFISDGSNSRIYIDGTDESGALANFAGTPTSFMLGYESDSSFDGIIDEFRVSNTARSASWINTGYNNMVNQSTFISVDSEQYITNTSIDRISPYIVAYSPYNITATAADVLDNVTLWYRYSSDNASWDGWMENITDSSSPWYWSYTFPNGTGYYEFYSIGNLSGYADEVAPASADAICFFNASLNAAPSIDLLNPSPNGTTGISTKPICRIRANDGDGDTLTVYWYENTTGSWVLRQTNSSVLANSIVSWTYTQASDYSTTYWWRVAVNDSMDNTTKGYTFTTEIIDTSVDTITPYTITSLPYNITATGPSDLDDVMLYYRWSDINFTGWDTLTYDDFESGWGNYTDGGGDCHLSGNFPHQGVQSSRIRDNSGGTASMFYLTSTEDLATPGYNYLKVDFWFYANGMEAGEDFWLQYDDGTGWVTVADYDAGDEFVNGQYYHEVVWINESVYDLTATARVGFRCSASDNGDEIYIDQVWVNATTVLGNTTEWAIWSNASNPDTESPWSWEFDFPNSTGYYEFYSVGNKSGSPNESAPGSADAICYYNPLGIAPSISLINPAPNGKTGVNLLPLCQIWANDSEGDTLTVYWYENTTGSWVLRNTNNSVSANSIVSYTFTEFSNYSTTYWWKVAVNDSTWNTSAIFYFTTEVIDTSVDPISPYGVTSSPKALTATGASDLDNVNLYYRWSDDNSSWGHSGETTYDTPTIDTTASEPDNAGASSMSWTHTVSSGLNNSILIVCTNVEDDDAGDNYFVASADFNGDALTRAVRVAADEGFTAISEIWYLLSPDEGSHIVTVNFSIAVNNALGGSASFSNVNQSIPDDTSTSADTGSPSGLATSVTTAVPNSLIIAVATDGNSGFTYSYGSDQTEIYNVDGSTHHGAGSYRVPSDTGNYTMHTNLSGATNRMSQAVVRWAPSSTIWGNGSNWAEWSNVSNPDIESPWGWSFDFPNGTGYYEFYSVGNKSGSPNETAPVSADANCYYKPSISATIINNYDLRNATGSKLNNATGLLDVNDEFFFSINLTDYDGWADIDFINITAWYDQGNDSSYYNQTSGGNLNMYLQYENVTGTANWTLLWPDNEAQLVLTNCTETIINEYSRIINISFIPKNQIRWASSNDSWDSTQNTTNDPYSWNFNISVTDTVNFNTWINDEYGVYKYTSISPSQDWVDVVAAPGFSDTSNIVTITYSSNYDFNMTLYFEEDLINTSRGDTIAIANNVDILADADLNDDITSDFTFLGIGESNDVEIFNDSGIFSTDNVSQIVNVQFDVFIPLGTLGGRYTARVATKISQD